MLHNLSPSPFSMAAAQNIRKMGLKNKRKER
jgi:hypothetical protein